MASVSKIYLVLQWFCEIRTVRTDAARSGQSATLCLQKYGPLERTPRARGSRQRSNSSKRTSRMCQKSGLPTKNVFSLTGRLNVPGPTRPQLCDAPALASFTAAFPSGGSRSAPKRTAGTVSARCNARRRGWNEWLARPRGPPPLLDGAARSFLVDGPGEGQGRVAVWRGMLRGP